MTNTRAAENLKAFGIDPRDVAAGYQAGRGVAARRPVPPSLLEGIAGTVAKAIPRAGMAIRVLNAGPVADGTLEYARRMGWVK